MLTACQSHHHKLHERVLLQIYRVSALQGGTKQVANDCTCNDNLLAGSIEQDAHSHVCKCNCLLDWLKLASGQGSSLVNDRAECIILFFAADLSLHRQGDTFKGKEEVSDVRPPSRPEHVEDSIPIPVQVQSGAEGFVTLKAPKVASQPSHHSISSFPNAASPGGVAPLHSDSVCKRTSIYLTFLILSCIDFYIHLQGSR